MAISIMRIFRYWWRARTKHRRFKRLMKKSLLINAVKPKMGLVWFSAGQIKKGTDDFSCANLIGQGSFGMVYKGKLPDGPLLHRGRVKDNYRDNC